MPSLPGYVSVSVAGGVVAACADLACPPLFRQILHTFSFLLDSADGNWQSVPRTHADTR